MSLKGVSDMDYNMGRKKDKKTDEKKTWYFYGVPLNRDTLYNVLYILAFIVSSCILMESITFKLSFWSGCAGVFMTLSAALYYYSVTEDKQHKDYEIAKLKQEIRKLESIREGDKHIIELLEKELEQTQNTSQQ